MFLQAKTQAECWLRLNKTAGGLRTRRHVKGNSLLVTWLPRSWCGGRRRDQTASQSPFLPKRPDCRLRCPHALRLAPAVVMTRSWISPLSHAKPQTGNQGETATNQYFTLQLSGQQVPED